MTAVEPEPATEPPAAPAAEEVSEACVEEEAQQPVKPPASRGGRRRWEKGGAEVAALRAKMEGLNSDTQWQRAKAIMDQICIIQGVEYKTPRGCANCKRYGHNIRRCPLPIKPWLQKKPEPVHNGLSDSEESVS